jgi:hypothetical protein
MYEDAGFFVRNECRQSQFVAEAEIAGIAETRYNVLMLVHARVYCCAPDGGDIVREHLFYMVDAFGCGNDASHMNALWRAFGEECFISQLHASARGKHRVGNDEVLLVNAWRSKIFHMNAHLGVVLVGVFAICTHESIASMVENVQKSVCGKAVLHGR